MSRARNLAAQRDPQRAVAVLRQGLALSCSWTSPSQPVPMLPVFTGRAEELARLDALLEDSTTEPRTTALIAFDGMSGVATRR
ncbi:hypothetical protein [Streptomyces sp. HC307]|uniref:hypothetical protein n=1 Tax=Streptomyces flavusporus TaxID=3385496 RepID=UPI0039175B09